MSRRMTRKPQPAASAPRRPGATVYTSIDSAPPEFSVPRPFWYVLLFLLAFVVCSALSLLVLPAVESFYTELLRRATDGLRFPEPTYALRLRPFFFVFFLAFSLFASGSPWRRLKLAGTLLLSYVFAMLFLDTLLLSLTPVVSPRLIAVIANVSIGFAALIILAAVLLLQGHFPLDERVQARLARPRRYAMLLLLAGAASALVAILVSRFMGGALESLRSVGLLGGLGPGIVLFFPLCFAFLALYELTSLRQRKGDIRYSIAFLVPAFNEEDNIAACIQSLDRAAQHYGRLCQLYVVDNDSKDATKAVAQAALDDCKALKGQVLSCPEPGKSKALNAGLRQIKEDIVVRVDADTLVSPHILSWAIPHFSEPAVGAVSGLPLPRESDSLLSKMRAIEVYLNQGFGRLGLCAVDGLLSMPGIFSAYRRSCLVELEGFAEGINGEDTDIVLRTGRLGYRLVNDPRLQVYSEVPATLGHLREQRLRWFRSIYHVASRNRSAMTMRQGVRGSFTLPWALVQSARRSMMVPILVYAVVVAALEPTALYLRSGATIVAILAGSSLLISLAVLAAYRRWELFAFVPAYLGFRLLRAYLSLDSLFTLPLGPAPTEPVSRATPAATPQRERVTVSKS